MFHLSVVGPVKPANIGVNPRGTETLNITWTLPEGRVDHYVVSITNEELKLSYHNTTTETYFHFTDLKPGRVYVIAVSAVAGNFNETSEAHFATGESDNLHVSCHSMFLLSLKSE